MNHRLTHTQKQQYEKEGYLLGLPPVFNWNQVKELNEGYQKLTGLLRADESVKEIREWHESSRWLYEVCTAPGILDYVEDLLGPDFFLWGSNFFAKAPHTSDTVDWHQDAYYWPLSPHNTVTIWLAFTDADHENGAMKVIPGSHRSGIIRHVRAQQTDSVLTLELEKGSFRESEAVQFRLEAGEISIHDDCIVHGSPANPSDRWRIGLTIRYSGTNVKCDLSVNPHFRAFLVRGVDRFRHNPQGVIPTERFARLERRHLSIEEAGREDWHAKETLHK